MRFFCEEVLFDEGVDDDDDDTDVWFEDDDAAAAVALRLGSPRNTRVDFKSTMSSASASKSLNLEISNDLN